MHSFAPTCILFIINMVQTKTMGNASFELVPAVLETPEARHRLGPLFVTASEFGSPTLEESYLSKKEGRRPKDRSLSRGLTQISRAGNPKRRDLTATRQQGRLLEQRHSCETPRSRGVGTLGVAGPLTTSLRRLWFGGLLPPDNGGTSKKGGDPRTVHAKKGTRTPGWHRKEKEAQLPLVSEKRYSQISVGCMSAQRGGGPKTPVCEAATCRGNCWRVVDGQ